MEPENEAQVQPGTLIVSSKITDLSTQSDLLNHAFDAFQAMVSDAFPVGVTLTEEELVTVASKFSDISDAMTLAARLAYWGMGRALEEAIVEAINSGRKPTGPDESSGVYGITTELANAMGISTKALRVYRATYRFFGGDFSRYFAWLTENRDPHTLKSQVKTWRDIQALTQATSTTKVHSKEDVADGAVREVEKAVEVIQKLNEAVVSGAFSGDEADGVREKLIMEAEELYRNLPVISGRELFDVRDVALIAALEYQRGGLNALSGNNEMLPVDAQFVPHDLQPWIDHVDTLREQWLVGSYEMAE